MSERLRKCPFCGNEAMLNSNLHRVFCSNAFCMVMPQTQECDTDEDAIKAWNRRVPEVDEYEVYG